MNEYLLVLILVSEMVSVFLIYKVWKSKEYLVFKVIGTFLIFIPFVGPLFILFIFDMPSSQNKALQNRGGRGHYTHSWISQRGLWKSIVKEKKADNEKDT